MMEGRCDYGVSCHSVSLCIALRKKMIVTYMDGGGYNVQDLTLYRTLKHCQLPDVTKESTSSLLQRCFMKLIKHMIAFEDSVEKHTVDVNHLSKASMVLVDVLKICETDQGGAINTAMSLVDMMWTNYSQLKMSEKSEDITLKCFHVLNTALVTTLKTLKPFLGLDESSKPACPTFEQERNQEKCTNCIGVCPKTACDQYTQCELSQQAEFDKALLSKLIEMKWRIPKSHVKSLEEKYGKPHRLEKSSNSIALQQKDKDESQHASNQSSVAVSAAGQHTLRSKSPCQQHRLAYHAHNNKSGTVQRNTSPVETQPHKSSSPSLARQLRSSPAPPVRRPLGSSLPPVKRQLHTSSSCELPSTSFNC